jgi:hypothetical protein
MQSSGSPVREVVAPDGKAATEPWTQDGRGRPDQNAQSLA